METLNNIQGLKLTSVETYDGMIEYVNSDKSHSGELVFITDNPSNDAYFKEDENGNKTYPRMYVIVLENDEYNFFPLMDNDGNYVDFQEGERMYKMNNIATNKIMRVATYDEMMGIIQADPNICTGDAIFVTEDQSNDFVYQIDEQGHKIYPYAYTAVITGETRGVVPMVDKQGKYFTKHVCE